MGARSLIDLWAYSGAVGEYQKSFTVGCLSWHWKYARWSNIVALTTENMTDASVAYHCILVKYESNGRNI